MKQLIDFDVMASLWVEGVGGFVVVCAFCSLASHISGQYLCQV